MPLWVQDQAVHWLDVPPPQPIMRGELGGELAESEQTDIGGLEMMAFPEPQATWQEVGRGRGPDGPIL